MACHRYFNIAKGIIFFFFADELLEFIRDWRNVDQRKAQTMHDATQMFAEKSKKKKMMKNKHYNKTGCINHMLLTLSKRKYIDYQQKECY